VAEKKDWHFMAVVTLHDAIGQLLAVLREAFEGAANWSYFTDHGAGAGIFGTLANVSAAEASQVRGGSSIAAHAHHVVFSLDASAAWIRGDRSHKDWAPSWGSGAVDDAAWSRLREQMREKYQELLQVMEGLATASIEALGGAVGAVAHMAYHLGAIKQKIAFGRKS
jgi:hypothetical protein